MLHAMTISNEGVLPEMSPSYGQSLIHNPALRRQVRSDSAAALHINDVAVAA
jgi:hypothetical protein